MGMRHVSRKLCRAMAISCVLAGLVVAAGCAQNRNPACAYTTIDTKKYGGKTFRSPRAIRSAGDVLRTPLTLQYAHNTIGGCPVMLRNYDGYLVGPTMRVKPGDTLEVELYNQLPPNWNPPPMEPWFAHNGGYNFNVTNFHTHGWWVDPNGNSDNVLRHMEPQEKPHRIRVHVPKEHPAGTFWYHAHVHGSTAVQVSSGMAGTLIVEGGLDDVPTIAKAQEQIFVFQQIAYDEDGKIESLDLFGPEKWIEHKRHTLINGQLVPRIYMRPGEVQRWRFIHAGIREALHVQLEGHALHEVALDGLSLGRVSTWKPGQSVALYPGYRSDVMVKAKVPGDSESNTFLLLDAASSDERRPLLAGVIEEEKVLAEIVIEGEPVDMALPTSKDVAATKPRKDLHLSDVTPGAEQRVEFNIAKFYCDPAKPGSKCRPCAAGDDERQCGENSSSKFMVNERPFSKSYEIAAKVGTVGKWTVTAAPKIGPHPFHIHVNPFQTTRIGPDGKEENIWKDTLIATPEPSVLLTRYERFTGTFVMHCHILDHEDQGMMSLVEIQK